MPSSARRLALRVLGATVRPGGPTLAEALAPPEVSALDERERAFLHELTLGTLRRRGWLDFVLSRLSSRPLAGLEQGVRDALRLGCYQLLFTRVPPHAALSESVDLARSIEPRAAGFVNAVLRRLQREGPPAAPDPKHDALGWLTSVGSLPAWVAERWLIRLGADTALARARALLEAPPSYFRLNPRAPDAVARLQLAGLAWKPTPVAGALELLAGRLTPFLEDGTAYAMDVGSLLVAGLVPARGRVLDACAAPGGKSLAIADAGAAMVVAAEASARRVRTLQSLGARWRAGRVVAVVADARHPPFRAGWDSVLLDAPCSGLGTLARRPDIRWRLAPGELSRHAERQRALIEALAPLVRPGGCLVYATCSVEPEENDAVVLPFLQRHQEFAVELPPDAEGVSSEGQFLRMEPATIRGDAFFAARLLRRR